MNAVNVLALLVLVWSFTAVCQPIGDFNVSCDNVTGTVGKEVILTCSISQCNEAQFKKYKFLYPESFRESEICTTELNNSCKDLNNVTCRYTSNTTQTGLFEFFLQAQASHRKATFIVNITEEEKDPVTEESHSEHTVATSTVSCFVILLVILFTAFCIMQRNKKPCGFPKGMYKTATNKMMTTESV